MADKDFTMRFGTQYNDEKAVAQNARFQSMSAAAERNMGGSKAYKPEDLELFKASEEGQRIIFRGELPHKKDSGRRLHLRLRLLPCNSHGEFCMCRVL